MERNLLLKIQYDGSAYHGWQVQENISQIYIGKDVDGIEDFADKNNLKVL